MKSYQPQRRILSAFIAAELDLRTFAISLQLFPASLIVFNRCSSAGVHGVFVLLFFATGGDVAVSDSSEPVNVVSILGSPDDDGAEVGIVGYTLKISSFSDMRLFLGLAGGRFVGKVCG